MLQSQLNQIHNLYLDLYYFMLQDHCFTYFIYYFRHLSYFLHEVDSHGCRNVLDIELVSVMTLPSSLKDKHVSLAGDESFHAI